MNVLNARLVNVNSRDTVITVDGKVAEFKKDSHGGYAIHVQTENSVVNISAVSVFDVSGKFWWLVSLFYFIISVFGIFDYHGNFKCQAVKFSIDIPVSEYTTCTIRFKHWSENKPAIIVDNLKDSAQLDSDIKQDSAPDITVHENLYFYDTVAHKRRKIMRFVKIALLVATVICVGFIVF